MIMELPIMEFAMAMPDMNADFPININLLDINRGILPNKKTFCNDF
jgi:hypothetical protein